jgi:hypothetical protein
MNLQQYTIGMVEQRFDKKQLQKMIFINNALQNGWSVRKTNDEYIFTKKHENKKEIFQETYLETFISENMTKILVQ